VRLPKHDQSFLVTVSSRLMFVGARRLTRRVAGPGVIWKRGKVSCPLSNVNQIPALLEMLRAEKVPEAVTFGGRPTMGVYDYRDRPTSGHRTEILDVDQEFRDCHSVHPLFVQDHRVLPFSFAPRVGALRPRPLTSTSYPLSMSRNCLRIVRAPSRSCALVQSSYLY